MQIEENGKMEKRYVDQNGAIILISSGISDGKSWMACRVKIKQRNESMHRVKSKFLPLRNTRAEAQADLDAYANNFSWKELK